MTISIGNASAPRWYDLSLVRIDAYIEHLIEAGARCTEIVLHRGEADDPIRRVHVLEPDWDDVIARYQAHGLSVHIHAPLHPRFKLARWASDREELQAEIRPVLERVNRLAGSQEIPPILVLHGASDDAESTAAFLDWAAGILAGSAARIGLELRPPVAGIAPGFDRSRDSILAFVEWLGNDRVGICWDMAHDWETKATQPDWVAEPSEAFLQRVCHVHLHDANADGLVHAPLQAGNVPWPEMISALVNSSYAGSVVLEIRYRLALALGDPWMVLHDSYRMLGAHLRDNSRIGVPG